MNRMVLCSTRGVRQEIIFEVQQVAQGWCVRSEHRIEGCVPRTMPGIATPLPFDKANLWVESRAKKLARSPALFVSRTQRFDAAISELFGLP